MKYPRIFIFQQNSKGDSVFALDPQYRGLFELSNGITKRAFRFSRCEYKKCVMDGTTCAECPYNHGEAIVYLFM